MRRYIEVFDGLICIFSQNFTWTILQLEEQAWVWGRLSIGRIGDHGFELEPPQRSFDPCC